ncbi:hypothetical protein IBL26_08025 [Roseomonas aerophila]|uniref:Uncharacterized protein n=1 Tax=Teichococcus aerophilus TaxID=1224513 RepID=A0ABR7RJM2_9PROT|nr:hypothetical protein [Pseudoroseomonas aerophila]MBC9206780.1 hypothetical protein [Pseudoroseomonas aerophila]
MRDFVVQALPWVIGIASVGAFLAVGGAETSAGRTIAAVILGLGVVAIAALPLVLRWARRNAAATRRALERDLDQRHRERQEEDR